MEVDLSDFLNEPPRGRKATPIAPKTRTERPLHHVICTQCGGSGRFIHLDTLTPVVSDDQERILERFNRELPRAIVKREEIKCTKCEGHGHHAIADDVRAKEIVMWWTRSTCTCGMVYEGPAHTNSCTVRQDVYQAMVHLGVHKGWRYIESVYVPRDITPEFAQLPMRIETFEYKISACRKCIHEKVVICLPAPLEEEVA